MDLAKVGAHPTTTAAGEHRVRFGLYLPGIRPEDEFALRVFLVHAQDQFDRSIPPHAFDIAPPAGGAAGHFGQAGTYLYRYQLLRGEQPVVYWFADPFARAAGLGSLSAFTVAKGQTFAWSDGAFRVPEIDGLVVYELAVAEFNQDFVGVVRQVDYLAGLGVNALELMPVTNVPEKVEWGFTPLGYFAPDERLGGQLGMKRLAVVVLLGQAAAPRDGGRTRETLRDGVESAGSEVPARQGHDARQ